MGYDHLDPSTREVFHFFSYVLIIDLIQNNYHIFLSLFITKKLNHDIKDEWSNINSKVNDDTN
jgi:hypothetical protein